MTPTAEQRKTGTRRSVAYAVAAACCLGMPCIGQAVTSNLHINISGGVTVEQERTCSLDRTSPSGEVLFSYNSDRIPNFYYLVAQVASYNSAKTGSQHEYFRFLDYQIHCTFKPNSPNAVWLSYTLSGSVITESALLSQFYLASTQSRYAGFMMMEKATNEWIDFKRLSTPSSSYAISPDRFSLAPDGTYRADLNYAIAFAGADFGAGPSLGQTFVDPGLISAGAYSRNMILTVSYS